MQHEDLHEEGEGGEEEDGAEEEVGHPLLVPPGPLNQEEEVVERGHDGVLSFPSPLRRMRVRKTPEADDDFSGERSQKQPLRTFPTGATTDSVKNQ